MNTDIENLFKDKVLGHPAGLFVLFFTEMWERFSYYGMRALLVLFLISSIADGGFGWDKADALTLYSNYTMLVYITPIFGGLIADKLLGYRWAVIIGALLMTIGHAAMAVETPIFLYIGLAGIILGNGLFKPNMTSIISKMYKEHIDKKDGAYSIFYMGVNAGAFLGYLLCGYLGENYSWSLGFGLAGIFMFLGMLQFYFTQNIFGSIGLTPKKIQALSIKEIGKDGDQNLTKDVVEETLPKKVVSDRFIAVLIFMVFNVFFWAAFEQAGGSMTIFASEYTQRNLTGVYGTMFKYIDALITIVPMIIISYVLYLLFKKTFKKYSVGNIILTSSFLIIWGIVLWKVGIEFNKSSVEVPASWFGSLNSLFIIMLAPAFSKWWESKYTLSGPLKFGLGLLFLGIGFGFLALGANGIIAGEPILKVSMFWLIAAYLFHTMGELCISPVSLSYVSKLVPAKWIGFMFGLYYLFLAMGNKLAGTVGSYIEVIEEQYSISGFFLIFTIVPAVAGLLIASLNPIMKKLMHGIK